MATVSIDATGGASRPREWRYQGEWWLATKPGRRVPGTITVKEGEVAELEVIGSLVDPADSGSYVLLGQTLGDHGAITACVTHLRQESESGGVRTQRLGCLDVLAGGQFPAGASSDFEFARLETANLSHWVSRPRPTVDMSEGGDGPVRLECPWPATLSANVPGLGKVDLAWVRSETHGLLAAEMRLSPTFFVEFSTPRTLDAVWDDFVSPLIYLLTLTVGAPDSVRHVGVGTGPADDRATRTNAEWLDSGFRNTATSDRWERSWIVQTHLLPFDQFEDRFEEVLGLWFEIYTKARATLIDLLAIPLSRTLVAEDEFGRAARALESWHRDVVGGKVFPDAEFGELLERVVNAAGTPALSHFVRVRMEHQNEPTFKQRADAFVAAAGSPLTELVASYNKFTRRVTDTRNSLAHTGTLGTSFTHDELYFAQKTLELMLRAAILRELGFDEEYVGKAIRRTDMWNHTAGWAGNPLRAHGF